MKKLASKINRIFQDYMRPKRLALGKWRWDRKLSTLTDSAGIVARCNIIDELNINSVLFLRCDGKIGDMVINTLIFRELKKAYPKLQIGVVAKGVAKDIIAENPYIDRIYDYSRSSAKIKKLAAQIQSDSYDLVVDFTEMLRVKQMMFLNLCAGKYNLGINKVNWNLFDLNLSYQEGERHISDKYAAVLKVLGIKDFDLSYDLHLSEKSLAEALSFRDGIAERRLIVVNPYGASKHRTLNIKTVKSIVDRLIEIPEVAVTFVCPPDKREELQKLSASYAGKVYFNATLSGIQETASMIKVADLVITPDTSIVHIAVAFDKRMVAIYRSEPGNNAKQWGPGSDKVQQIFSEANNNLAEESDINNFAVSDLINAVQDILSSLESN